MKRLISLFLTLAVCMINMPLVFAIDDKECAIGITIDRKEKLFILGVFENSSAHKAGLKPMDEIIEINDLRANMLSLNKIFDEVKGPNGTEVKFLINRNGENKTVYVKRDLYNNYLLNQAPEWEEFCPAYFLNAEYKKPKKRIILEVLVGISIVGLPYTMHMVKQRNKTHEYNYWVSYWRIREEDFHKNVNSCLLIPKNQNSCFMQIRQIEQNKTAQKRQEQLIQEQIKLQKETNELIRYGY